MLLSWLPDVVLWCSRLSLLSGLEARQGKSSFVSGTRLVFQQSLAPPGWVKEVGAAFNDSCMRIVTGAVGAGGGATVFSSVFGAGKSTAGFTLTTAEISSHTHPQSELVTVQNGSVETAMIRAGADGVNSFARFPAAFTSQANSTDNSTASLNTQAAGGGGSHSHGLSLDLKFNDVIIAQKI
jgi:hypothetical protein